MEKLDYIIGAVVIITVIVLLWLFVGNCLLGKLGEMPGWCLLLYG